MRFALLFLLTPLSWAADNVCTFTKPSGATGCNGSNVCATSGIAADSTRAYWSCTVSGGGNGYVPAAPDSIAGPTGYTLVWDDRNFDMGASGKPYFSYPAYVVVDGAGTLYVAPPTATVTDGTSTKNGNGYFISAWVYMNGSGGVSSIKFRTLNGAFFAAASDAPTITLSDPGGGGATATAHIVMQPGGGTPAILANGSFQVQIASGHSATLRGDVVPASPSGYTGVVKLLGNNTFTFDSSSATPLNDGTTNYYPKYSLGASGGGQYRAGLDFSACAGTCTITSNVNGGHGLLYSMHGFGASAGAQISTGRETLSHLGDAATPMYEAGYLYGGANTNWNMPSYSCTDCGSVLMDHGVKWGTSEALGSFTFRDGGTFEVSPGESNFRVYGASASLVGGIANAVYDKGYGFSPTADTWNGGILGTTITNSYIGSITQGNAPGAITTSIVLNTMVGNNTMLNVVAPLTHGVIYWNRFVGKPQGIASYAASTAAAVVSDIDVEAPTDWVESPAKPLYIAGSPSSPTNYTWTRINLSPSKTNGQQFSVIDFIGGHKGNIKGYWEHITMFGGVSVAPLILLDEGGETLDYPLGGFRSNLVWTGASPVYSVFGSYGAPSADPCGVDGSVCGYNATESPTLNGSCAPPFANCGNGYYTKFTSPASTGGQTDVHPPNLHSSLVDTTRRVATWYLDGAKKAIPTSWAAGESIAAGELRASANPLYYSSQTVAYRATRAHTASVPLRPDGPGFNVADGSLTSVVASTGYIRANLGITAAYSVQLGDWVYCRGSGIAGWRGAYQVTGVGSNWFEAAGPGGSGTYADSTIAIDVWQNWWEPASLYQIRQDISGGTTYTQWVYGCNACAPAQAVQQWIFAGLRPTNETLRGYTYPGDTNPVTNPGAVKMAPLGIFPLPGGLRRR